jgi:hypothetical protein
VYSSLYQFCLFVGVNGDTYPGICIGRRRWDFWEVLYLRNIAKIRAEGEDPQNKAKIAKYQ